MATLKRAKTPTRLQMEAVECGAAALAIILEYHGSFIPLERLREECGISRDGSKASNIVKAARRLGFEAKGYRKSPEDLKEIEGPVILHWQFVHFLVLEGFGRGGKVYLNDPAMGPRTITEEELDQAFTGVVLTFKPKPDYVPQGKRPSALPSMLERLKGSHVDLLFIFLVSLALVVPALVIPIFTRIFVDEVMIQGSENWFRPLLAAMLVVSAVQALLVWLKSRYLLRLSLKLSISMSAKFLWHTLFLPSRFFSQRHAGDIVSRVRINDRLAQMLSATLIKTILDFVLVAFYGALMLYYDWFLTLTTGTIVAFNIVAVRVVSRKRVDMSLRTQQEQGRLSGIAMSGLRLIETYKASGQEDDFFSEWAGQYTKVMNAEQKVALLTQVMQSVPMLLSLLSTIAVLVLGAMRVVDGALTPGMLVAFQALMIGFIRPIGALVNFTATWQVFQGDLARLNDVMIGDKDPNIDELPPHEDEMAIRLKGHVEISELSFGYNPLSPPLLEGFHLQLNPGGRVALVGGSGSGKSTVARVIVGLYRPWKGEIIFDGTPRNKLSRLLITNSVAMVDQEIFLFEGTVRSNLTMWNPTISEATIIQAARDACIHDDIMALSDGYDAMIQEGGRNFSGGQRQRLEIARALCLNPTILVLDEATSALDPETEKHIDRNLRRRGCTCIIVAHRLSTIRDSDEILVLSRGRVVERGDHNQLMAANNHYAALIEAG